MRSAQGELAPKSRATLRHLDESQRGLVAGKSANLGEGRPSETSTIVPVSQAKVAAMLNDSVPTVKRSNVVIENGAPELQDMVTGGEVSSSVAISMKRADYRRLGHSTKGRRGVVV